MLTEIHQLLKNESKNPENKIQCELGDIWEEKLLHVGEIFGLFQSRYSFNKWSRFVLFPKEKLKIIDPKIKTTRTAKTVQQIDYFVDRWKPPDRRPRHIGNDLCVYTYTSTSLIDLFKRFFFPNYIVPGDIKSLREHLECIWLYYRYFYPTMDFIPVDVGFRFEFVIHKVICQVLLLFEIKGLKMLNDFIRIQKSIKPMGEKKNKLGELIIKEFHLLKDSTKKKVNTKGKKYICNAILKKLDSKVKKGEIDPREYRYRKSNGENLTSIDTIRRRLEDKNLI